MHLSTSATQLFGVDSKPNSCFRLTIVGAPGFQSDPVPPYPAEHLVEG